MTIENQLDNHWRQGDITPAHLSPNLRPIDYEENFCTAIERRVREVVHRQLLKSETRDVDAAEHDAVLQREMERLVSIVKIDIEAHASVIARTAKERQEEAMGARNRVSGYRYRGAELELQQHGPVN